MLCEQVRDHLSAYVDRELTAELSAAVRAHLESCPACKALLADLRATADLVGRLPVRSAPEGLADDVLRRIERQTVLPISEASAREAAPLERTIALHRTSRWPRAVAVAAGVLLVVGIGILAIVGPGEHPGPGIEVADRRGGEEGREPVELADASGRSARALAEKSADEMPVMKRAAEAAPEAGGVGGVQEKPGQTEWAAVPQHEVPEDAFGAAKVGEKAAEALDIAARLRREPRLLNMADVEVQTAMNRVAQNEAPLEELKAAANPDNLRQASNTLVVETDAPDEANRDLQRLFFANGWQSVSEEQVSAAAQPVPATGKAAEQRWAAAKTAPPAQGYYYLAHADGETTWVVVADWDDLSRFSGQLANVDRITVGKASTPAFRAIRDLQLLVRSQAGADRRPDRVEADALEESESQAALTYSGKAAAAETPAEVQAELAAPPPPPATPVPAPAPAGGVDAGTAMWKESRAGEEVEVTGEAVQEQKPTRTEGTAPAEAAPAAVAPKDEEGAQKAEGYQFDVRERALTLDETAEREAVQPAPPEGEQALLIIRVQRSAEAAREAERMGRPAAPAASGQ